MADDEPEIETAAPEPVEEVQMSVLDALKEVRFIRRYRLDTVTSWASDVPISSDYK
jgi:hypothetical protein